MGRAIDNWITLVASEHDKWDQFVDAAPNGTIFNKAWWYRAWGMEPVVQACLDQQGGIRAGICFSVGKKLGTKGIVRPPLTPRNGPVYLPSNSTDRTKQLTHAREMLLGAINALPRLGMYNFTLGHTERDVIPFIWNGFDATVTYTYRISCSEKDSWRNRISSSHRKSLAAAAREVEEYGYQLDSNPPIEDIAEVIRSTAEYKGFAFRKFRDHLPAWWKEVTARSAGIAYLVRAASGRPLTVMARVRDARTTYSVLGGMVSDIRSGMTRAQRASQTKSLLVERAIRDSMELNLDFDFEGSLIPGVESHYRRWGGELCPILGVWKFSSPVAYGLWYGRRYWTRHRNRSWAWYD
jgi:hypothetical protein